MNDFVELHRLMSVIARRWWLLVVLTAFAAGMGYFVSRAQPPVYEATATLLVGQSIRSAQLERVDIQTSQALLETYVDIARRQPVLEGVVQTLGLQENWLELRRQVTVSVVPDTQLIEISVEANSPETASAIADEVAHQLLLISPAGTATTTENPIDTFSQQQVAKLQGKILNAEQRLVEIEAALRLAPSESRFQLEGERSNLEDLIIQWERNYTELLPFTIAEPQRDPSQLTVIESGHAGSAPIRPRVQLNLLVSGGIGLVLALVLIFLLEFADDTYKSLDDISHSKELAVLGIVGNIRGRKHAGKLVAHLQPHSALTEAYRIIRSRIRYKSANNPARSIMITSALPKEGKSTTAANLAVVFAQANIKTIIVDADFRQPMQHHVFRVKNETGLGDLLNSSDLQVEDHLQNTSVNNLQVLTAGKALSDASERLGSERMREILVELKKVAEIVIFDSPPVLVFADAVDLSRQMDGVIMMIRAGKSRPDAVNQSLSDLRNAGANFLGSIFSHSPKTSTLTIRKQYSQERTQFLFDKVLRKKAVADQAQLRLHEAAGIANADVASPEGNNGRSAEVTTGQDSGSNSGKSE